MGNERAFSEGRAEPAVEPVGERLPLASLFTGIMKKNIDSPAWRPGTTPHRISLRLPARLLRFSSKGG